jgi:ankyrin repeat protein
LGEKLGPIGGQYADSDRAGFVFHMLDEFIHHGAEIALLRDLHRAEREAHERDPLVRALLAGDAATVTAAHAEDLSALDRARTSHPDLILEAVSSGRWHAVELLLESGFAADVKEGAGPLHHAAGAGRLDVVKLLVDHGADIHRTDPNWRASAKSWAEYFRHRDVVEYLASKNRD